MTTLGKNRYGKATVRIAKINRARAAHEVREWAIDITLSGDFTECFENGDNREILPTDTMANVVYSLARESRAASMEEFGKELAGHFLSASRKSSSVEIAIGETIWNHLTVAVRSFDTVFEQNTQETHRARVLKNRSGECEVITGFRNLTVLKTAKSEFTGFMRDKHTTLAETSDRLLATKIMAWWRYTDVILPFETLRWQVRQALLTCFAEHHSLSIQHTLFAMASAALLAIPEMSEITLTMPNKHYMLADLGRFGQDNPSVIFVPIEEPHGVIEATVQR